MKRAIIDLPDGFEKGQCNKCPYSSDIGDWEWLWSCNITPGIYTGAEVDSSKCPLKIVDIPNINTKEIKEEI